MASQQYIIALAVLLVCSAAGMHSCADEGPGCGSLSLLQQKARVLHGKSMDSSDGNPLGSALHWLTKGRKSVNETVTKIHPDNYVDVTGHTAVLDTVLQNNLGGLGPDSGPQELRYGSVFKLAGGLELDLVVTSKKTYVAKKAKKNGLSGGFGQINVAGDNDVNLKFEFQNSKTKEPTTVSQWFMTIADVDHGSADMREQVEIGNFEGAFITPDSEILASVDSNGNHLFTSSEVDATGDFNPTDPMNISGADLRRVVVFEFMGKAEAKLRFKTPGGEKWSGRNFMFSVSSTLNSFCTDAAGNADLLSIPSEDIWNMQLTNLLHSNLGGVGPDDGEETMRFGEVFPGVDLVVSTASPTYQAVFPPYNGLYGNLGRLNIQGGNYSAELLFEFKDSNTDADVEISKFYFSFLDIDQAANDTLHERITISGYQKVYYLKDNLEVGVDSQGRTAITSTIADAESGISNPDDINDLKHHQSQRAVTFVFAKKSSFKATIDTLGGTKSAPLPGTFQCPPCGPHSRSIMFGGYTGLAETTETTVQC